jgi:lipopolysaccharide export system permease protein
VTSVALGAPSGRRAFWRPSILDVYLLRMLAAPAGAVLGVTLVAFLLDQTLHLIDQLAANGAHLSYLFGLVTNLIPYELGLALPAAFFASMFMVVARLDEESEIDAMLSGGISFERIVAPLVFAGAVLGVVSLLLVGYLQPYSRFGERVLMNAATDAGWTAQLDPQVFINAGPDFTISADEADATGRSLKGVFIRRKTQTGETIVTASDGRLSMRPDRKTTDLRLDGGMILADVGPQAARLLRFGNFTDHEVIAGNETLRPRGGNEEELTLPELLGESQRPDALLPKRTLEAELYARLARSFAIPLLPLLALPLAMAAKRGRRGPGMIIGAIILVMFHHGITLAKGFAAQGLLDPLVAIGSLFGILAVAAFWLFLSSRQRPGETPISRFFMRLEALFERRTKAPTAIKAKGIISLSTYLTRIMAVRTLAAAMALIGLLQLIDLLERTSGILARGGVLDIGRWILFRTPFLFQEVAPFAVLGGAIFTFSQLARNSELVVMRISGLSIFQIFQRTLPVALAVAVLDLAVAAQVTPRAEQSLKTWWNATEPAGSSSTANPRWFRIDGNVVMARSASPDGQVLRDVAIYQRDEHQALVRRVQAANAAWTRQGWRLRDAAITDLGAQRASMMTVAATEWRTTLRPADVARMFAAAYQITPETAFRSLLGRGPVDRSPSQFETRLFRTIAEGLAPIIMLLLALPTALGHARSNRTGPILFALGCGLLYLVTDGLLTAMGSTGILPPLAAAWGAPVAFAAGAVSILLYAEG